MASAASAVSGSGGKPTSSATPASPSVMPPTLRAVSGSPSQIAAAIAPKNGLVAFRIPPVDAVMVHHRQAVVGVIRDGDS